MSTKKYDKIYIEIGNACNFQCSFCPEVIRDKKLMPPEMFNRIADQIAPLTNLVSFHLMGDPLLHPRISELVDICTKKNLKIFLVTNGALLTPEKSRLLLTPAFYQVNFSLHSFYDNFSGRDPTEYLEKIFNFTESAMAVRPDLYINYRLWNLNDVHGSNTDNSEMLKRACARFDAQLPSSIDLRKTKSIRLKNRLYLHLDTEFAWPSLDLDVLGTAGRCHGLSTHFGILVDGTVVPCCLDKEAGIPLGNIADQPIEEILASERATKILEGFRNRKLIESLCQRCQYIERFS